MTFGWRPKAGKKPMSDRGGTSEKNQYTPRPDGRYARRPACMEKSGAGQMGCMGPLEHRQK